MERPYPFIKPNSGRLSPFVPCPVPVFIPCDSWIPLPEDLIFKQVKGAIVVPVSTFYHLRPEEAGELDYFHLDIKQRCYNSDKMREHTTHYLNYFEKFYDKDKELLSIYCFMKYLIDYEPAYNEIAFVSDIIKYILGPSMSCKVENMNNDNYSLVLNYSNNKNPGLQYNDKHGKILMEISVFMNMVIPLLAHFIYVHKDIQIKDFLMYVFNIIIDKYSDEVDIYSKLYETSITNINKNRDNHTPLWLKQPIRGKNTTTHAIYTVNNIILQIIPKYEYQQNLVHLNYKAVMSNIKFQITGIGYEYSFVSLSSTKRDSDGNADFDKFETFQIKADESLYVQNKVNAEATMLFIEQEWGPFDDDEVDFYYNRLAGNNGQVIMNPFQKNLVFNLFYKYFGDAQSIKSINIRDYIKLIIAGKRMLEISGLVALPYIISSKITRLATRANINKKEMLKIETNPYYPYIVEKYHNDKIIKEILSIIAIILSSEFEFIDYNDMDGVDGQVVNILSEFIVEEVLIYLLMI